MKKVLLGLAIMSSMAMASEGTNLYLKTGVDLGSRFDVMKGPAGTEVNSKRDSRQGYEIAVEVTENISKELELGIGVAFQEHGDPKSVTSQDLTIKSYGYQSVPLYVTGKYNFVNESNITPYLKTDLGYSFNFGEKDTVAMNNGIKHTAKASIDNGLYYGVGAGIEYNNFIAELMYKVNTADMKLTNESESKKQSFDYSRVTLSLGYRF